MAQTHRFILFRSSHVDLALRVINVLFVARIGCFSSIFTLATQCIEFRHFVGPRNTVQYLSERLALRITIQAHQDNMNSNPQHVLTKRRKACKKLSFFDHNASCLKHKSIGSQRSGWIPYNTGRSVLVVCHNLILLRIPSIHRRLHCNHVACNGSLFANVRKSIRTLS